MKKLSIVIVVMLLVLFIGQAAMAKVNILGTATLGYMHYENEFGDGNKLLYANFMKTKLSAQFDFSDRLSLWTQVDMNLGKEYDKTYSPTLSVPAFGLEVSIFAKYNIIRNDKLIFGVQVGVNGSYDANEWPYIHYGGTLPDEYWLLFVTPGVYANISISSKFNTYIDVKIPVSYYGIVPLYPIADYDGFFSMFFYDICLGVSYNISPGIIIGLEGTTDNANSNWVMGALTIKGYDTKFSYGNFGIGLKVEFAF